MKKQNVMIPLELVERMITFLSHMEDSKDREAFQARIKILAALLLKVQKLRLRDSYSKILYADNEQDRDWARIEYLESKNRINSIPGVKDLL
jgi:hypothetical protein